MKLLKNLFVSLAVPLISLIATSSVTQAQDFEGFCDDLSPCDANKFLKCSDNLCGCENPVDQIYDSVENHCVIRGGGNCSLTSGTPACIQGAECDPLSSTCKCTKGFYETELNLCTYNIGKTCKSNGDCDASDGLVCLEEYCKCPNSSYIWQLELGCVTLEDIMALSEGNETSTISAGNSSTTELNETLSESPISSISTPGPFEFSILTPNYTMFNNSIIEDVDFGDEMPTSTPDNVFDRIEPSGGGGLVGAVVNLLTPGNRRPPAQTLFPYPTFQAQNENRNVLPNYQQSNQNQQQMKQNYQVGQNIQTNQVNQNDQGWQNPPKSESLQQRPPEQSFQQQQQQQQQYDPNFQQPARLPTAIQNTMNLRYPAIIRNIITPWRRFLFPGIQEDGDFRLPSPIWLTVATVNQILPVLRALDHQFSPWLKTLAVLTQPKYIPQINNNNNQYQSQQQQQQQQQYQQPNNNYNNGQFQQNNNRINRLFPLLGR